MDQYIQAPVSKEDARSLKAGDYVYLSGTIYTARDAAHKRMKEALDQGQKLPFDLKGSVIYYMGPSPPSGPQVRQRPAEWINTRRSFWILVWAP